MKRKNRMRRIKMRTRRRRAYRIGGRRGRRKKEEEKINVNHNIIKR